MSINISTNIHIHDGDLDCNFVHISRHVEHRWINISDQCTLFFDSHESLVRFVDLLSTEIKGIESETCS